MLDEYSTAVEEALYEDRKQVTIEGITYTVIANEQNIDSRRWADINMLVLQHEDNVFGLCYDIGSTESQEDMGFFEYSRPELVPVRPITVTRWVPE